MATSLDFARALIAAADRDLVVLRKGVPDPEMPIEALGFHCQQAVEKCIKAVLAMHEIEFRKIHDIRTLTDLARDAGLLVPRGEQLEALTPFAVEFRYQPLAQGTSRERERWSYSRQKFESGLASRSRHPRRCSESRLTTNG